MRRRVFEHIPEAAGRAKALYHLGGSEPALNRLLSLERSRDRKGAFEGGGFVKRRALMLIDLSLPPPWSTSLSARWLSQGPPCP